MVLQSHPPFLNCSKPLLFQASETQQTKPISQKLQYLSLSINIKSWGEIKLTKNWGTDKKKNIDWRDPFVFLGIINNNESDLDVTRTIFLALNHGIWLDLDERLRLEREKW